MKVNITPRILILLNTDISRNTRLYFYLHLFVLKLVEAKNVIVEF